ncbi:MAG: hypothetical protein LBD17_01275 [Endomicrobium sp.]|jgi:hypothetical protein|nr:hypothetical protein [Endomicrobium sp.]
MIEEIYCKEVDVDKKATFLEEALNWISEHEETWIDFTNSKELSREFKAYLQKEYADEE